MFNATTFSELLKTRHCQLFIQNITEKREIQLEPLWGYQLIAQSRTN